MLEPFCPLLNNGASINARDHQNKTPLHLIIEWKNEHDDVTNALSAGADPNSMDCHGHTPLHTAIHFNSSPAIIKALLTAGADPNAIDYGGNTPLHATIDSYSCPAIIKALLIAGADIEMPDARGMTPLIKSIYQQNSIPIIQTLLSAGADVNEDNLMVEAIKANPEPEVIKLLIIAGAAVNRSSLPPLFFAVLNDNLKIVQLLLAAGARIDFVHFDSQWTLLHHVRGVGVTKELIKRGIDVNAVDNLGEIPLHVAVAKDYFGVATTLIKAGADVHRLVQGRGDNCLHLATSRPMVKMLVSHGININARSLLGLTPLHMAAWFLNFVSRSQLAGEAHNVKINKVISAIKEMIKCGADINATDNYGRSALELIVEIKSPKIILHMIKRGVKVSWMRFFSMDAINRYSIRLLIREWLIRNRNTDDLFHYPFEYQIQRPIIYLYAYRCQAEIELMQVKKINCHNTIYHYVVEIAPKIKALKSCSHYEVNDKHIKDMFPIYKNKILVRLGKCYKRAFLLDILEKIYVCVPTPEGKRVSLINDCKFAIAEFLSNNDLVYFLLATGLKVPKDAKFTKSLNCGNISPIIIT